MSLPGGKKVKMEGPFKSPSTTKAQATPGGKAVVLKAPYKPQPTKPAAKSAPKSGTVNMKGPFTKVKKG